MQNSMDDEFHSLAPDAWNDVMLKEEDGSMVVDPSIIQKLVQKSMGIKGLLLDQKRAISGVGNYLADEVLYQIQMHPDQRYLTEQQSENLLRKLHDILETANQCLYNDEEFPKEWLFHYRWTRQRANAKDAKGRTMTFITSGGRTSAIVPAVQKLRKRSQTAAQTESPSEPPSTSISKGAPQILKKNTTVQQISRKRRGAPSGEETTSMSSKKTTKPQSSESATARCIRRSARLSNLS
jgi:formamidopyrimidine-DNA glycosylase